MSADGEDEIRETTRGMARGGDEMEHRLDELGKDIRGAKATAKLTEEQAGPAGDWEDESEGAQQGEDASDGFDDPEADEREEE